MEAQPKRRHARARAFERQALAGGEREIFRWSGTFHDHRAQRAAGERIVPSLQKTYDIADTQQQKARRVKVELQPTCRSDLSIFDGGKIRPDPQNGFRPRHASAERRRKTRRRRFMARLRKNLVQRAPAQPALQTSVSLNVTEQNLLRLF